MKAPQNRLGRIVTVNPVAIVCATVAFSVAFAGFILLVLFAPREAELYLRPLIGAATTIGTGCLLWWRTGRSEVQHSSENAAIIEKADNAAEIAEVTAAVVDKRLNGDLDKRIAAAVRAALDAHDKDS